MRFLFIDRLEAGTTFQFPLSPWASLFNAYLLYKL